MTRFFPNLTRAKKAMEFSHARSVPNSQPGLSETTANASPNGSVTQLIEADPTAARDFTTEPMTLQGSSNRSAMISADEAASQAFGT